MKKFAFVLAFILAGCASAPATKSVEDYRLTCPAPVGDPGDLKAWKMTGTEVLRIKNVDPNGDPIPMISTDYTKDGKHIQVGWVVNESRTDVISVYFDPFADDPKSKAWVNTAYVDTRTKEFREKPEGACHWQRLSGGPTAQGETS